MALPRILYKDAWENIEEMDDVIFITWNPKPRFYPCTEERDGLISINYNVQWLMMLQKLVLVDRCCRNYGIVAEVSDTGKLHCHGFLVLKDKIKYNKQFLPTLQRNGFVKVTVAKSHKWFEYHVEDVDETIQYIHKYPHLIALTPVTIDEAKTTLFHVECKGARTVAKERKKLSIMTMFHRAEHHSETDDECDMCN